MPRRSFFVLTVLGRGGGASHPKSDFELDGYKRAHIYIVVLSGTVRVFAYYNPSLRSRLARGPATIQTRRPPTEYQHSQGVAGIVG